MVSVLDLEWRWTYDFNERALTILNIYLHSYSKGNTRSLVAPSNSTRAVRYKARPAQVRGNDYSTVMKFCGNLLFPEDEDESDHEEDEYSVESGLTFDFNTFCNNMEGEAW